MFENFRSFADYINDYELQRAEGLLLRHLSSVYKVLAQTVPDGAKTDDVLEMEVYFRTLLRQVDSSLETEWALMREAGGAPIERRAGSAITPAAAPMAADITRDSIAFTAAIRTRVFTFLRAWAIGRHAAALDVLGQTPRSEHSDPADAAEPWTAERLQAALEDHRAGHERIRFDPEGRNARHTHVKPSGDGRIWRIQQVLVDADGHNDWMAEFDIDLAASRAKNEPAVSLRSIGPIG